MQRLLMSAFAFAVSAAMVCPLAARAEDTKDGKIVVVIKIPSDLQDIHKRTHPTTQP